MAAGPKVAVLGAGSVGCFIGGAWAAGGVDVTFIGRPKLSKDVDQFGLTLSDYSGWEARLPPGDVDYRCGPEALEEAQLIALTVKSGDTAAAADEIARHGTPGATVISFQNGVSNVDALEAGLGGRFEVARGMVPYNVAYLGNGRFHKGVAGDLYSGEMYRQLYRVLKRGGRLVHYIGDLDSTTGRVVAKGAVRRLQEAGFRRVLARREAFGVLALK